MKKIYFSLILLFCQFSLFAQIDTLQAIRDSINTSLNYQTGVVALKDNIATLTVPKGFKYLNAAQSNFVLSDLWGNPSDESSLGMLFPENMSPLDDSCWAFNITYDAMGYVEDDDADDIDYDELLTEMQAGAKEENDSREQAGYEKIEIVGWAAKPFYDDKKHILHWAKEIKFGDSEVNTLNYNVRVLGRKGVLVLNAIASIPDLDQVNKHVDAVSGGVAFTSGNTYSDFNPEMDEVAAYTVGGLVAGKVLAKAGFFALLLKSWKLIVFGIGGAASFILRLFTGKKEETA